MKLLTFVLVLALNLVQNGGQSVDVGRAKAKISAEEMLKLHRKRREDDKLFSINSPRRNDNEEQVSSFDLTKFLPQKNKQMNIFVFITLFLYVFYEKSCKVKFEHK